MIRHRAVILAAGYGKRMLPLTKNTPKPLLPEIDNSLLFNQINFLKKFSLDVTVTIGYKKQKMLDALKNYKVKDYIYVKDKGNAYWLNSLKENKINGPIVVITSDNLMEIDLNSLLEEHYKKSEKSLIVSTESFEGNHDKLAINSKNEILSMSYQKGSGLIASGLQVLNTNDLYDYPAVFNDFHDVWEYLISKKKLHISELQPEKWINVDTVEDLEKIKTFY